jgi:hypothetical protein
MNAERHRPWWQDAVLAALVVFGCVLVYAMPALSYPASGLDPGWRTAVNQAAAARLVFGRDVIFTVGPYAAVYTGQYDPTIDARMFAGSLVLGLPMAAGLLCLARGALRAAVVAVPVFMMLLRANDVLMLARPADDVLMLALPAAFILVGCRLAMQQQRTGQVPRRPLPVIAFMLLVLALSLLPLIKGSFAVLAIGEAAIVFALLLWQRAYRLAAAEAVVLAVGTSGFWWMIGQPPAALPPTSSPRSRSCPATARQWRSAGGSSRPWCFCLAR